MHRITKLKNGLTLITVPVKGTIATTVMAMFPIGSRYEEKPISGASHFVEHLMFKGTIKRPVATEIARELDALGADYNAFTFKDYTGYYVKIDGKRQEVAYELLADMLYNSQFKKEEVEKEKGAIVEELRMYEDNPTMAVDLLFDRIMFGDHPLGWDIGGSVETVRGISREELWKYYQRHYSPRNMILVVAGNIDPKKIKLINKYFGLQASAAGEPGSLFYKTGFAKFSWPKKEAALAERVAVKERVVDQAQLMVGFPGLKQNHPERFAAIVLITILGIGMSSRLFVEVREKRGLAYMIKAGSMSFRDVGAVYIQAGLDPARLAEAISVIKEELWKITHDEVSGRELEDAKSSISGRMALAMEDSSAEAEWFAKQFLFSAKPETPEQVLAKIKKVTAREIIKLAARIFIPGQLRLAVIGKFNKEKILELIA